MKKLYMQLLVLICFSFMIQANVDIAREIQLSEDVVDQNIKRACSSGSCSINGSCGRTQTNNACCPTSCVRPNPCNPCNPCQTRPNPCNPCQTSCNPCDRCPNPCPPCPTTCNTCPIYGFFGFDSDGAITDQSNGSLFSVMPVTPPAPALRAYKVTFCTPFCCLPSPVVSVSVLELISVTNVTVQSFQVNLAQATAAMVFFHVAQVS